jgi:hypothetical protein
MYKLPADGVYHIHVGDTARHGGPAYGYRLRVSEPRPQFALRIVPSSVSMRSKSGGNVTVYAIYKDGFNAPITLNLKDAPEGFTANAATLAPGKEKVGFTIKSTRKPGEGPFELTIEGTAKIGEQTIARDAVAADDRMQAFLWRHLVPARRFLAMLEDPGYKRPQRPSPSQEIMAAAPKPDPEKTRKFTKKQAAGELRRLERLYQERLMTEKFFALKAAECEASE